MKNMESNTIVGLDIGTSKVAAIVGEINHTGNINIIGMGSSPCKGLKRGVVVNIDSTVNAIQSAVEEAELMTGTKINSVYTGIAGAHVKSLNSHGIVAIRNNEVSQHDLDRVVDAARAVAIPSDQKILHVLPQGYIIDSNDCIREPIGMSGVRLESKVHIVTGSVSAVQNIVRCVQRCGLNVSDIVLEQLASSYSVLSDDERELGICVVDIGGGTTDIAIFADGAIRHTAVIPIAGDQVTNDIAIAIRAAIKKAEEIKLKYASACNVEDDEFYEENNITYNSADSRVTKVISKKALSEICEARYEELFNLIKQEIRRSGFINSISAGLVFTGGASLMPGILDVAERVFQMPIRIGSPECVTSGIGEIVNNPKYATGIGLLMHALIIGNTPQDQKNSFSLKKTDKLSIWKRMGSWFKGKF